MTINNNQFYHIHNKGINYNRIFFNHENYNYFIKKLKKILSPVCDIIAYCLMPDHFHLLIQANEKSIIKISEKNNATKFSEALRILLSSYTQGVNKQRGRKGSLFCQNTLINPISPVNVPKLDNQSPLTSENQLERIIHYIHQNPCRCQLVNTPFDWEFSSLIEYSQGQYNSIVNTVKSIHLSGFDIKKTQQRIVLSNLEHNALYYRNPFE